MRNLFQQQSSVNEKEARKALIRVVEVQIEKHVKLQNLLSRVLAAGGTQCLPCKIDQVAKRMAKIQAKVDQLIRSYELFFNETIDTEKITEEMCKKHFPLVTDGESEKSRPVKEGNFVIDLKGNNKEDMDNFNPLAVIREALEGKLPEGMKMSIIDGREDFEKGENSQAFGLFGVNPKDYKNFESFSRAVKAAMHKMKEESMTDEEKAMKSSEEPSKTPIIDKAKAKAKAEADAKKASKEVLN